jgi:hypothetical protein
VHKYADTSTRHQMQADLRRALRASSHMPSGPLVRPLPSLVSSCGWADAGGSAGGGGGSGGGWAGIGGEGAYDVVVRGDVVYMGDLGFWKVEIPSYETYTRNLQTKPTYELTISLTFENFWQLLAEHPRSQPADVMSLLELLAHVLLTDARNSAFAAAAVHSLCRTLVRHASVRAFLERTLKTALAALCMLCSEPQQLPQGALYGVGKEMGGAELWHDHTRALQNFVKSVGGSESSRPMVVDGLRAALSRPSLGVSVKDDLILLLHSLQGQNHLSVTPSLLPPVVGASPLPPNNAQQNAIGSAHSGYAASLSPPPLVPGAGGALSPSPLGLDEGGSGGGERGGGYSDLESRRRESREGGNRPGREVGGVEAEGKVGKVAKTKEKKERNPQVKEEPKKERARDKKQKKQEAQGDEACKEALRLRAFKSAEEVFVMLAPDAVTRQLTALLVRDSIKTLKIPAQIQAQMLKELGWFRGGGWRGGRGGGGGGGGDGCGSEAEEGGGCHRSKEVRRC